MYRPNKKTARSSDFSERERSILINFEIDKKYLLIHCLESMEEFSDVKEKPIIVVFQNYAWNKSQKMYDAAIGRNQDENVSEADLDNYLEELIQSKEFKPILDRTQEYREWCIEEWNKHYVETLSIMSELTGLTFDDHTVFITHPGLCNGGNIGNKEIVWGHAEDFPHYFVVYMWHEILHSYLDNGDLAHALIELLTDNELRVRLNTGKYPLMEGHQRLEKLRNKILPEWKRYLRAEDKNIIDLLNKLKTNGI